MISKKSKTLLAMGVAASLSVSILGIGPAAWAAPVTSAPVTAKTVRDSLGSAGNLVAEPVDSTSPLGETVLQGGTVAVPMDPAAGISLEAADGVGIQISIPGSEEAQDARAIVDGAATYLGEGIASTVLVAPSGVQVLTTIANKDAPTRYDYSLELEPGQRLTLDAAGLPIVVGEDGQAVVSVLAPWAKDSLGNDVPTRYEVEGNTLTQVVDHTASADVAYPVVADPFFIPVWVLKCLAGIGIKGPQISAIMSSGTPWAVIAGLGRGALACFGV